MNHRHRNLFLTWDLFLFHVQNAKLAFVVIVVVSQNIQLGQSVLMQKENYKYQHILKKWLMFQVTAFHAFQAHFS